MSDDKDLSSVHEIILDVYKEFRKICEKNNLRFFAISGTTIGAVLWKGIIPWDDDMDIAMPVEDYKKLLKLCSKKIIPNWMGFIEYKWFGLQLYDNRTMFTNVYYLNNPERFSGVSIDVVPLINIPNDKNEQKEFIDDFKRFHKAAIRYDRYNVSEEIKSEKEMCRWRERFLNAYKFGETDFVMDFSDDRYVLKASGFENPLIMKFEDTTIPVSSNYDEDLTIQYGKYKKYPPKEKRVSLHQQLSVIDLDKACGEYGKILKESPKEIWDIIQVQHRYGGYCEEGVFARDESIKELMKNNERIMMDNEMLKDRIDRFEKNMFFKFGRKVKVILKKIRKGV